jgi:hypothetical protein
MTGPFFEKRSPPPRAKLARAAARIVRHFAAPKSRTHQRPSWSRAGAMTGPRGCPHQYMLRGRCRPGNAGAHSGGGPERKLGSTSLGAPACEPGGPASQPPAFCFFTERFERYRSLERWTAANFAMHDSDIFQWTKPDARAFRLTANVASSPFQ